MTYLYHYHSKTTHLLDDIDYVGPRIWLSLNKSHYKTLAPLLKKRQKVLIFSIVGLSARGLIESYAYFGKIQYIHRVPAKNILNIFLNYDNSRLLQRLKLIEVVGSIPGLAANMFKAHTIITPIKRLLLEQKQDRYTIPNEYSRDWLFRKLLTPTSF